MAEIYNVIYQFRRGTSEAWEKNNPILAEAEPGFEVDKGRLKIGDGITPWNSLKYQGGSYSLSPDEKSLVLNDSDLLTLKGYDKAKQGQMLVKDENEGLAWVNPLSETVLNTAVANAQSAANIAANQATQAGNQAIAADLSARNAARALEIIQKDIFWFGTIDEYNALEEITEDKIYVILT